MLKCTNKGCLKEFSLNELEVDNICFHHTG